MRERVQQVTTIVIAIALFTGMTAAPVAAQLGGDSLGIGDGIVDIGTDDGGVDVAVGGDSGVEVGASPNDGVEVGAAGEDVSVGPDSVGSGGVGDVGSGAVGDATSGGLGDVGAGVTDGALGDTGAGEVPDSVSSLAETPQGVESVGGLGSVSDVTTAGLLADGVPSGGLPSGALPTDGLPSGGVGDTLPGASALPTDQLPSGGLGPDALPEQRVEMVCDTLNADQESLPVGSLPSVQDIPESVQPSSAPTSLLSNDAVFGIITGFIPGPCEVFDPTDPQIDPTNPPTTPDYTFDVSRMGQFNDGFVYLVEYGGTLNETSNEPGISGSSGMFANPTDTDFDQVLVVNDGRNDYGGELHFESSDSLDTFQMKGFMVLLGGNLGGQGGCEDITEYQPDLSVESLENNPMGPCQFKPVGLTQSVTPGLVIGAITGAADTSGEPPVNTDSLPVNPGALLNL